MGSGGGEEGDKGQCPETVEGMDSMPLMTRDVG